MMDPSYDMAGSRDPVYCKHGLSRSLGCTFCLREEMDPSYVAEEGGDTHLRELVVWRRHRLGQQIEMLCDEGLIKTTDSVGDVIKYLYREGVDARSTHTQGPGGEGAPTEGGAREVGGR